VCSRSASARWTRSGEHKGLARKAQVLRGFRAGHVDACVFQAFDEVAGLPVREPALQELRGDLADVILLALLGGKAEDDPENGESGGQLGLFS